MNFQEIFSAQGVGMDLVDVTSLQSGDAVICETADNRYAFLITDANECKAHVFREKTTSAGSAGDKGVRTISKFVEPGRAVSHSTPTVDKKSSTGPVTAVRVVYGAFQQ